uniref:Uncharacterized protein n=1 Tax=Arundo donax TaxID=35708 RepID=A0A0A9F3E4_ARUDO
MDPRPQGRWRAHRSAAIRSGPGRSLPCSASSEEVFSSAFLFSFFSFPPFRSQISLPLRYAPPWIIAFVYTYGFVFFC